MTRCQPEEFYSNMEPIDRLFPEASPGLPFTFSASPGSPFDEEYFGFAPSTVRAIHDAIDRENQPDPADIEQERANRIRAAAEEEMHYFQGYVAGMISELVEHAKSDHRLAFRLSQYDYGCSMAAKLTEASAAGRDPMEILGITRLRRQRLAVEAMP